MPANYTIIDDKKFMWDGRIYETGAEAKNIALGYEKDNFETRLVPEDGKYLVYSRRAVKEAVIETQN